MKPSLDFNLKIFKHGLILSDMSHRPNPILKVILLGDSGVGKSSIINRYVNDRFVENNMQTIGVDLFTKVAMVEDRV